MVSGGRFGMGGYLRNFCCVEAELHGPSPADFTWRFETLFHAHVRRRFK